MSFLHGHPQLLDSLTEEVEQMESGLRRVQRNSLSPQGTSASHDPSTLQGVESKLQLLESAKKELHKLHTQIAHLSQQRNQLAARTSPQAASRQQVQTQRTPTQSQVAVCCPPLFRLFCVVVPDKKDLHLSPVSWLPRWQSLTPAKEKGV